ncbi:MAG: OmpA family protein [Pseudomonadota bacterium]
MRVLSFVACLAAAIAISGCSTPETRATNAPATGFASIQPGSEEDFILNVGRRTYFQGGSAILDSTATATLDRQAEWLNANQRWKVKVQGFSDDPGDEAVNVALSTARADAVMAYLVSKGVDQQRLWTKGYGRERLTRDCADITCKSQNRHVRTNLREEFDASAPQVKAAQGS